MVLKYVKYLTRSCWQLYAAVFGLLVLLTVSMPLWADYAIPTALISLAVNCAAYFILYWPAYVFYRSLYGREAALTHQIPCRGRTLLHGQLLFGLIPYWFFVIFSPGGFITLLLRTEYAIKLSTAIQFRTSEFPWNDSVRHDMSVVMNQLSELLFHRAPYLLVILIAALLAMSLVNFLSVYSAICFAHRKGAGRNHLVQGILGYIALLLVEGVSLGGLLGILTVGFLVLEGGKPEIMSGFGMDNFMFSQAFQGAILVILLLFLVWSLLFAAALYLYIRRQLEKGLNLV